jgi:hypothetical protein
MNLSIGEANNLWTKYAIYFPLSTWDVSDGEPVRLNPQQMRAPGTNKRSAPQFI